MAYSDIDSGKVLNKEGLLELCSQIKTEIANNSGSSNEVIPSAPTTDGTYMLKCVVSSGTPTYSWEEITVGGSY